MIFLVNPDGGATVAKGRTSSGRLKRGYTISKSTGRVVKAKSSRKRSRKRSGKRRSKRRSSTRRRRDSRGRFVSKGRGRTRRNPPRSKRKRTMAKRKRDARGRFVSTGRKSTRKRSSRKRTRRRSYKRNPPMGDIVKRATDGAIDAIEILGGKAIARTVPGLFGLSGNLALAAQAAVAIIVGELSVGFLGRDAGEMLLAGGLSAPLEQVAVNLKIPYVSAALSAYPELVPMSAYPALPGMAAYPSPSYDVEYGA